MLGFQRGGKLKHKNRLFITIAGLLVLPIAAGCASVPAAEAEAGQASAAATTTPVEAHGITLSGYVATSDIRALGNGLFWDYGQGTVDVEGNEAGWMSGQKHPDFSSLQLESLGPLENRVGLFAGTYDGTDLGDGEAVIAALDLDTGDVLWDVPDVRDELSDGDPNLEALGARIAGKSAVIPMISTNSRGEDFGELMILDLRTGEQTGKFKTGSAEKSGFLSDYPDQSMDTIISIMYTDPLVVFDASIPENKKGNGKILDPATGKVLASLRDYGEVWAHPLWLKRADALSGGKSLTIEKDVLALKDAGGKVAWKVKTSGVLEDSNERFAVLSVDDKSQFVILNTADGTVLGTIPYVSAHYPGCTGSASFLTPTLLSVACYDNDFDKTEQTATAIFSLNF